MASMHGLNTSLELVSNEQTCCASKDTRGCIQGLTSADATAHLKVKKQLYLRARKN
jgi:hypothetical protein